MSQTLSLALKARTDEGSPLPGAIPRLDQIGVKLRRGQLSLIAAAPGGGKSALATYWMTRIGVPTMYFSADADRMTVAKGITAGLLNRDQDSVEELLLAEDPETIRRLEAATEHVWWSFDTMPSLWDINEEVEAYAYVHGEYPHLIIVDNLMDVEDAGENLEAMSNVQLALKGLARHTGAHVMVLAHVTGSYTDGNTPIPRSGMMWKPDKKAELILTLYNVQPGTMGIRVVKNRTGQAMTDASFGIDMGWIPSRSWFSG